VEASEALVNQAEAILVAGTSLTVNSGLRLVKRAQKRGIPIVIVNQGDTKADSIANVKLSASTSNLLGAIFND
jgi:NAD-dependent SIR2 family protein deacetylase